MEAFDPLGTGVINLDELTPEKLKEYEATYGDLFLLKPPLIRQCAEGLILDGETEYRCELERCHPNDHQDGEHRWQTY